MEIGIKEHCWRLSKEVNDMSHRVEDLYITKTRNEWGWFIGSALIDGTYMSIRYDWRPNRKKVKEDLIQYYERS